MIRAAISLTGILIAGALFFLYTQPAYDSAQGARGQIAKYDQALQKAAELQQLKQTLLARNNAFNPAGLDRLQKLLPDHVDNVRLILDMDDMATRRSMQLSNVNISGNDSTAKTQTVIGALGASNQKYDSLMLGFTTTGTYENFKQFLNDIQSSLRIVDVTSLTIAPGTGFAANTAGGRPKATFSFGVKLKTYWLK